MHTERFTINREYWTKHKVVEPRRVTLTVPYEIHVPLMVRRVAPRIYDSFKVDLMESFLDKVFHESWSPDSNPIKEVDMQVYKVLEDRIAPVDDPDESLNIEVEPKHELQVKDIVVKDRKGFMTNRLSRYLDDYDMTMFACADAYWPLLV